MDEILLGLENFFSLILGIFNTWLLPFLKSWWWVLPPFLLWKPFTSMWLWWRREMNWKSTDHVMLEIRMPRETIKPTKAMEDVFSALTVIDNSSDILREVWIEGANTIYPPLSFEMASIGGESHFFIWVEKPYRHWVESAIYSQYPEAEILEVEDYTKRVPQDIPNEKWELEGREFVLKQESGYPIKTYIHFETGTEPKEEKRVDPLAGLLEGFSILKQGENLWIQILATLNADGKWLEEGKKVRDKLAKRPEEKTPPAKPIIQEAAELLIKGPPPKKEEKKEQVLYTEMMLTPGEREIVQEIERKISKSGFNMAIRVVYLAPKDVFFKPHMVLGVSFLKRYATENLNSFKGISQTSTKVKSTLFWYLDKRRAFLRKRKMFRNYLKRLNPLFPMPGGTAVLNTEELASLFHFPSRMAAPAPSVPRIGAKKGEAPSGLPVE